MAEPPDARASAYAGRQAEPGGAGAAHKGATMSDLMKKRADIERALAKAEARWLEASEALEEAEADAA